MSTTPKVIVPGVRQHGILVTVVGDETIVYDTETHKVHHLNPAQTCVWNACQVARPYDALLRELHVTAKMDDATLKQCLQQLQEASLMSPALPGAGKTGMNRRRFMKMAGAAGAIAVPAIFSISAPAVAHAGRGQSRNGPDRRDRSDDDNSHGYDNSRGGAPYDSQYGNDNSYGGGDDYDSNDRDSDSDSYDSENSYGRDNTHRDDGYGSSRN